jgi:predicted MPP superfamily phosphohydrolase
VQVTLGKMEIASRFFQIVMPQQNLNGVQVGTGFQHMRGEAVTEDVGIHLFLDSSTASGVLAGVTRRFGVDLSHNPKKLDRAAELGIDFTLAAHTYGGQLSLELALRRMLAVSGTIGETQCNTESHRH